MYEYKVDNILKDMNFQVQDESESVFKKKNGMSANTYIQIVLRMSEIYSIPISVIKNKLVCYSIDELKKVEDYLNEGKQ